MTDGSGRRPPRWAVALAFASIYLIWGSTYLAIRYAIETIPPMLMAGCRFVAAGGIVYLWSRARGAPRPTTRNWRAAVVIGGLLLLGGNGGVVWAEQRVPSGLAALLVATVPVWTVLLQAIWPGGQRQRPSGRLVVGLVVGIVGMGLLVAPGEVVGGARVDLAGAAVLTLASLSWSAASIHSRAAPLPASPFLAAGMEMLAGGALLFLAGTVAGEWGRLDLGGISVRSAGALAYLVVFGSLVGFTSFIWLLGVTSPARVATYAYVNPVVAVLLGWALASEPLTPRTLIAAAIIVGAVALITTAQAARRHVDAAPAPLRQPASGGRARAEEAA
ncbi:MAG TPA: EamA family transporter [Gemmatimonadales bacterium]|nr:EamA family transporter [Gemmatimonadales bacterium]